MRVPKPPSGQTENLFPPPNAKDARMSDILVELRREFDMRKMVYPKWVTAGKMSADVATARLLYVEAAIMWMERLENMAWYLAELEQQDPEDINDDQVES